MKVLILFLTSLLPAAVGAQTLVVKDDFGGAVSKRFQEVVRLNDKGVRVKIVEGVCASSCTLYLGVKDVCVERGVTFQFHGPSSASGIGLPPRVFEEVSKKMSLHYPPKIREWFITTARYVTQTTLDVTGEQIISTGIKECDIEGVN